MAEINQRCKSTILQEAFFKRTHVLRNTKIITLVISLGELFRMKRTR